MHDLPNPLTPVDCDLRGLRWMPLDVVRVIDSDTFGLSTGDEFKTAFRLWAKCWLQVPAASLPDDDRLLAHLAGLSENMTKWASMRTVALRGFIKCNDGRLYHPVIAEKAIEAMGRREEYAEREENQQTRQQRLRERRKSMFALLREHDIVPAWDTKTSELERLIETVPVTHRGRTGDAPVTPSVSAGDAPVTDRGLTGDAPDTASNPSQSRVSGKPVTHRGRTGDAGDKPATAIEKDRTGQDSKPKTLVLTDAGGTPRASVRPAELSAAMRRHSIEAQPGDPRIIAAAEQGISVETIEAACAEAKTSDPNGRIKAGFVIAIAQRWTADATKPRPAPRSQPRSYHDERADTIAGLTGRDRTYDPDHDDERTIDVHAHRIA